MLFIKKKMLFMKFIICMLVALCCATNLCATPLENALQECFPNTEQTEITAKLLLGGFSTDEKYIVSVNNQKYVLRLYAPTQSSRIDSEIYMVQLASKLEIGPKIHYVAKDKSFVLMEFLEGGTVTFDQVRTPEACVSVAKAIKILHSSPVLVSNQCDCLALYTDVYNALVGKAGKKPEFDEAINMLRDAYKELDKFSTEKVNTHSDLNPRNIFIVDGQAKFIDWADANSHDPFYDLALFSMFTAYTPELEKLLLQTYLGREIKIDDWQKFQQSKLIAYSTIIITAFYICFESNSSVEMIDDHLSYEFVIKQFVDYADSSHVFLMNMAHTFLREGRKLKASL
jgi:thiamine kinase-like enzyme